MLIVVEVVVVVVVVVIIIMLIIITIIIIITPRGLEIPGGYWRGIFNLLVVRLKYTQK